MKISLTLIICLLFTLSADVYAQTNKNHVPQAEVQNLDGSKFNTKDLNNDGKPMIINFWATCAALAKES